MEKLLSLPSRTAQRSLPCSVRRTGGMCWDTGRWHPPPAPAAGRAGAGKADPAGSWHRDSPLLPPWGRGTFGMGRIFSLFPQLSNSLSAVSSRGESQRSQPQFPPSQPREAASGTFPGRLEETPLPGPVLAPAAAAAPGMPNSIPEQLLQPSQGSQSSAPGFLFPGTTGTGAGFAAPRKKQELSESCTQPLLAPAKHHRLLTWCLGGGSSFSPPPTACSCCDSRISSCHGSGLSCWKGPVSISHFI